MDFRILRELARSATALGIAAAGVTAAGADDAVLEEIFVTGSRIARPDFTSASPIVSVDQRRFEESSAVTVEEVLDTLPQFVPSFGSSSNNPANGGQSNLSLRGLPTTATLVLMDGRRLMPANGTGVVDVNVIPPSLVESVEIITGGASAVYGSDALAGVVNFKLRREFEGLQLDALGAVTGEGDGDEYSFGLSAGTDYADGRGSVMGFVGYTRREIVTYADRDYSRYALQYVPPEQGTGTTGPGGQFVTGGNPLVEEGVVRGGRNAWSRAAFDTLMQSYGYAPGQVPFQTNVSFNDDGTLFTLGTFPPVPGGVANFRGYRDPNFFNDRSYTFNFAPYNALRMPLERLSFFGRADYEFGAAARVFAEVLYADYSVSQQLAPSTARNMRVPLTNPFIPDDLRTLLASRPNPGANFEISKRMSALGPRIGENEYDVLQATVGVQGDLGRGWGYDAYLMYGYSDQAETQNNNIRTSRFEELTFAPDGGVAICGGFDPFGNNPVTAGCAAYIGTDGTNETDVDQLVAEVTANGPLASLPAGELQAVVGAMFKRADFSYRADEISQLFLPDGRPEIQGFNASDDVDGYDYNTDLFVEVSVPLLADRRWAQSLEALLGYRWSDYASAGGVSSYKAELLHRPAEPVLLRGSFQHAVRAPSVYELYAPQLGPAVFLDVDANLQTDPCSVGSEARTGADAPAVERLCVAQGLPADLLPTFAYPDFEVPGVAGGNPDLEAETADTYTAGIVLEPALDSRWARRLQVSLDWYEIEVEGAIATVAAAEFVPRCYDRNFNAPLSPENEYCSYFSRDATTGEIRDAQELLRNIAGYRTSGIDLQFDWSAELGPGLAGINWLVGYVATFEELRARGLAAEDDVGTIGGRVGGALPEWKWNLRASYGWSGFDVVAQWRYVDAMRDIDYPDFEVPSQDYFDLVLGYAFPNGPAAGVTLRIGVENLTDADPPIFPSYVQANTDPSQYDVLGRRYFARMSYRF